MTKLVIRKLANGKYVVETKRFLRRSVGLYVMNVFVPYQSENTGYLTRTLKCAPIGGKAYSLCWQDTEEEAKKLCLTIRALMGES
jgi:hypothetical protein